VPRAAGEVPHHGVDDTEHLTEFPQRHGLPLEAGQGGADTALPEYMEKLPAMPRRTAAPASQVDVGRR
jgi:hypothetical protein